MGLHAQAARRQAAGRSAGQHRRGQAPAVEDDVSQAGTPVNKRSRSSAGTDLLAASSDAAELERGGPVPR